MLWTPVTWRSLHTEFHVDVNHRTSNSGITLSEWVSVYRGNQGCRRAGIGLIEFLSKCLSFYQQHLSSQLLIEHKRSANSIFFSNVGDSMWATFDNYLAYGTYKGSGKSVVHQAKRPASVWHTPQGAVPSTKCQGSTCRFLCIVTLAIIAVTLWQCLKAIALAIHILTHQSHAAWHVTSGKTKIYLNSVSLNGFSTCLCPKGHENHVKTLARTTHSL